MHEKNFERDISPTDFRISRMPPDSTRRRSVRHVRGLGWPSFVLYRDVLGDHIPDRSSPFFTSTSLLLFSEFVHTLVLARFSICTPQMGNYTE